MPRSRRHGSTPAPMPWTTTSGSPAFAWPTLKSSTGYGFLSMDVLAPIAGSPSARRGRRSAPNAALRCRQARWLVLRGFLPDSQVDRDDKRRGGCQSSRMDPFGRTYWVYILASRKHGTLYIGVTSDLSGRIYEHKAGLTPGFTTKYKVRSLVYFEMFGIVEEAIKREKQLKRWRRGLEGRADRARQSALDRSLRQRRSVDAMTPVDLREPLLSICHPGLPRNAARPGPRNTSGCEHAKTLVNACDWPVFMGPGQRCCAAFPG